MKPADREVSKQIRRFRKRQADAQTTKQCCLVTSICMYVCMCVCMHVNIYIYIYIYIHTYIYTNLSLYIYIYMYRERDVLLFITILIIIIIIIIHSQTTEQGLWSAFQGGRLSAVRLLVSGLFGKGAAAASAIPSSSPIFWGEGLQCPTTLSPRRRKTLRISISTLK